MLRWRLKACSRCGGDVYIDKDIDGWFEQCLQCSFRHELKDLIQFKKQEQVAALDKSIRWDVDDEVVVRNK
ncbi:MAG TPA: hypothetical protein VEH58_06180 [Dehalococcoidales bacterium]|nr:hypothetical protein [Dehalococcoidales bacterium]